jgi:hypothetical protein
MLPAATVRALLNPAFTAAEFTPTQWASAEGKAKFANTLMKFIANEFPRQSFTRSLYHRLSNTFGHIAHRISRASMAPSSNATWTRSSSSSRP